jgi:hypothetical protein
MKIRKSKYSKINAGFFDFELKMFIFLKKKGKTTTKG